MAPGDQLLIAEPVPHGTANFTARCRQEDLTGCWRALDRQLALIHQELGRAAR